ncbi:CysZ protein [Homoserinimonas aerilata]|uniref:CysZ protein n=1 Tax=Homoserinimonas aerilata TaxID=1162970 RepID=A0A542YJQ0_9MICO|nr:EI24 domain-containing protein [Homoserinimonas aerilata]TQL48184.1 CysZ protein [Homoserinimonas aerilata]
MTAVAPKHPRFSAVRGFFEGAGLLFRGFATWGTSPKRMLLGLIPGAITFAIYIAIVIAFVATIGPITDWLTPFASGWDDSLRTLLRIAVGLALAVAASLVLVYSFTVVTLAVGQPFFERISRDVDDALGTVPEAPQPGFWRGLWRGMAEALGVLALTLLIGLGLFLLSLVPVVGSPLAAVTGAFTGGWFLALELSAVPLQRRGLRFGQRRRMLGTRRSVTLGFGVVTFLLFLVPLGAIVTMPAAVAGGTLLARSALGEAVRPAATPTP